MRRLGVLGTLVLAGCPGPVRSVPPTSLPGTIVAETPVDAGVPDATMATEAPGLDAGGEPVAVGNYLKGSTHVHTLYSGDATLKPASVVAWYESRGYDFIVITDHNRVTDYPHPGPMLVLRGTELTNNPPRCEPAPIEPNGKCRIHVNALLVTEFAAHEPDVRPDKIDWRERKSIKRVDLYKAALVKTRELGGIAQLNHPRWHWGVDGPLLTELAQRGVVLVEIANMAFERWNAGDKDRASAEEMWDVALSSGATVWGVASDDAHHYRAAVIKRRRDQGDSIYAAGGGFVMVRADKTGASIRDAMARGDFYSSTGVLLSEVSVADNVLRVTVAEASAGDHTIAFIGTGGLQVAEVQGRTAQVRLIEQVSGYVRAVVTGPDGKKAWTQPVPVP